MNYHAELHYTEFN